MEINNLIKIWEKRNITGIYCADIGQAVQKIMEIIPVSSSIGFSGSVTLDQLDIFKDLESRGNKIFDRHKTGADYYLASANAISEKGELVFLSAYGNRTAGISYAKNVIIVSGVNKIAKDLAAALKRAREYATPLNYKRLNWPTDKRMCCQVLIIEAEVTPERLKVILIGETLGF